jgi:diguanylate cyclase (GGDEF)-like protein
MTVRAADPRHLTSEDSIVKRPPVLPQLDLVLIDELTLVQRCLLAVVAVIADVTLAAWLFPALGRHLPGAWDSMKANTALLALFSVLSLTFSRRSRSRRLARISQVFASVVLVATVAVIVEWVCGVSLGLDTWISADVGSPYPGRMSPQTCVVYLLLGIVMFLIRARKRVAARVVDLMSLLLCVLMLMISAGYLFGAQQLFGITTSVRTSLQTLVCLVLLAAVAFGRRAQHGVFGILFGTGLGSKIARIAIPIALLLPFLLEAGRAFTIHMGAMNTSYATAITTSMVSLLAVVLVLVLAWRIDELETEIRDLSLRDELTKLYNRRGFYLLAEQALQVARRGKGSMSVLFIDLDNLKHINDTHGHEIGSAFLCEAAVFLKESFRRTDVIGRIGGDEFVVAWISNVQAMKLVVERMEKAAAERNAQPGRLYPFCFSYGYVTSEPGSPETLESLVHRADELMYESKRRTKMLNGTLDEMEDRLV